MMSEIENKIEGLFSEIMESVKVFTRKVPAEGFEIFYLGRAHEICELYDKANGDIERCYDEKQFGEEELLSRLTDILDLIKKLM